MPPYICSGNKTAGIRKLLYFFTVEVIAKVDQKEIEKIPMIRLKREFEAATE